jgi:hypothetical protein
VGDTVAIELFEEEKFTPEILTTELTTAVKLTGVPTETSAVDGIILIVQVPVWAFAVAIRVHKNTKKPRNTNNFVNNVRVSLI